MIILIIVVLLSNYSNAVEGVGESCSLGFIIFIVVFSFILLSESFVTDQKGDIWHGLEMSLASLQVTERKKSGN